MSIVSLVRPLMAGVLHSFEPDHVTAISVLATENAITKEKTSFKTVLKASQWALGHSLTLLLFGVVALVFRSSLALFIHDISYWAEVSVGPIMIWLGVTAIRRNHRIKEMIQKHKEIEEHDHLDSNLIHLHGKGGEEIAMNPMNKSFWVGMLHGLAGTGGALTSALVISAATITDAVIVLVVECLGIIIAMGVYSYSLIAVMSRFIEKNLSIFKWMNGVAGLASILIGSYWIYNTIFAV
ncbi:cytochrome c biogenesis protein CcdA [Lutibacter citreus]|uniref:cytochrome c biogenesis protein CcdA n=1 Tax=Lutibacter citreus TaxID=2138210 RepID=UPI000DBE1D23|nr:cytochrome c biogenesis protein CcdA [Lutibacter citreus]